MKIDQVELYKKILEICGDLPVYLYGKSLLLQYLNKDSPTIDLFIKSKHVNEEIIFKLKSLHEKINVIFSKELTFDNEIFTLSCIYCELNTVIGKLGNIDGKHLVLSDIQKKLIRFIDKEKSSNNPKDILDAILLYGELEFNFEIDSMKHILINKSIVKKLTKRDIYHFLKNTFYKSKKPRKVIALINTLGLSVELFGTELVESSVLNNLGRKDINEFFALIFNNVDEENQEKFLIENVGFHLRDSEKVLQITNILNNIGNKEYTPLLARKLIKIVGKDKLYNLYRLFKALGLYNLSRLIKLEKNSVIELNELCVDEDILMKIFNVDSIFAKKLLDLALDVVIIQPEMNERNRLLSALNKKISSIQK